ncbi:hypothetical protein KI387_010943, partial [Taxus chinensis]
VHAMDPNQTQTDKSGGKQRQKGSNSSRFYKTKPCFNFNAGNCHNESCKYAHGIADLRSPPPNDEEFYRNENGKRPRRTDNNLLMGVCLEWKTRGTCCYGQNCRYLHQEPPKQWLRLPKPATQNRDGHIVQNNGIIEVAPIQNMNVSLGHGHINTVANLGSTGNAVGNMSRQLQVNKDRIDRIHGDWLDEF